MPTPLENLIARHPIVSHIRHRLFHCTSIEGLRGIQRDGCIRYNDGAYESSYLQSDIGFGRRITAISLFDFESASESEIEKQESLWLSFLSHFDPITAVILLDSSLKENIISNSAPKSEKNWPVYIPYVEAWFRKSISVDSIDGVLLVYDQNLDSFESFTRLEDANKAVPDRIAMIKKNPRTKTPAELAAEARINRR